MNTRLAFPLVAAALACGPAIASDVPFDVPWIGYDTAIWPEGLYPYDGETGDFNGDGVPDLASVSFLVGTPYLSVLFGDGEGGYLPPVTYETPLESAGVAVLDWDLDGDLDLAVSDTDRFFGGFTVSMWDNDGTGSFSLVAFYPMGDQGPSGIVAADFDGDGWTDLATANEADIICNNTVSVLRNAGGSGFEPADVYEITNCPQEIEAGDINGDGFIDLVIGHGSANRWTRLLNDGTGSFTLDGSTPGIPSGLLMENAAIRLSDLDLDGDLDVLYSQQDSGGVGAGAIGLWRNNGDGTFSPGESLSFDFWNRGGGDITTGDVTGDGWPDILAVTGAEGNWFLFENDGAGGFTPPHRFRAGHGPNAVRLSDLDSDGDLDVTILAAGSLEACVYLNPGDGAFVQPTALDFADPAIAPAFVTNVESGDLDGDGDLDLVTGFRSDFSSSHGLTVRLNNGDASFGPRVTYAEPVYPAWVRLADMDGDGDLDLLYLDASSRFLLRKNDGNGNFGPRLPRHQFSLAADSMQIAAVDVDEDGDLDVCANTGFFFRVSKNLGGDSYGAPYVAVELDVFTQTFGFGDCNEDGHIDLLTDSGSQIPAVRICFGNGDGAFDAPLPIAVMERDVHSIALKDLDHDGHLDLTAIHDRSPKGLTVRLGRGDGTFKAPQMYHGSFFFNQYTVGGTTELVDVDGDGFEDILFANTDAQDFSFWRNNGDGTFQDLVRCGAGHEVYDMSAGDYDGDGLIDVAMSTQIDDGQWFHAGVVIIRGTRPSTGPSADLDGDGVVGFSDLLWVLSTWGPCPAPPAECPADLDGDSSVGFSDLLIVLAAWGEGG